MKLVDMLDPINASENLVATNGSLRFGKRQANAPRAVITRAVQYQVERPPLPDHAGDPADTYVSRSADP